ncbi:MAG TPA: universal stress protein [Thermodesulfobacteriota bacterium]|nr:universal stress protein [Thermodesulfobacteriota bacterium]
MKILVYLHRKADAQKALSFAAALKIRLKAELAVITVQSGTQAIEDLPSPGVSLPLKERDRLPAGIQTLIGAMETFIEIGLLVPQPAITIRDIPLGHRFTGTTPTGERVPFYECFGPLAETLNRFIEEHQVHLLMLSPSRRPGLSGLLSGDISRNLVLDLHTSVLFVRGGGPDDRYVVCADGSPSARRIFPFLKHLLPAVEPPLEILWVKKPEAGNEAVQAAEECLVHADEWLRNRGKTPVLHQLQGSRPVDLILQTAGRQAVIVLGASLRHDLVRRLKGSLPLEIIAKTEASVLLVKLPHEADVEFFKAPFTC